jgi:hypothetical protein
MSVLGTLTKAERWPGSVAPGASRRYRIQDQPTAGDTAGTG